MPAQDVGHILDYYLLDDRNSTFNQVTLAVWLVALELQNMRFCMLLGPIMSKQGLTG